MSGEQVLRCGVIKQMHQFSYDRLAFHLADSVSLRAFCRLPLGWTPARSTLAENLSRIRHSTWQAINAALVDWACEQGLEKGEKVRIDATPVESEIHHPTDNQLLSDCVRVLARWLGRLSGFVDFPYRDHGLRARRRCLVISNARRQTLRIGPYRDLLKVTRKMAGYTRTALAACQDSSHPRVVRVRSWLEHYLELTDRVIDQTERRVVRGESVPAGQKVVSIFEEHTDLIRKGGRETVYGHKVFLSCGRSSLILDCLPVRGNPADSTYLETMLDRHCHQYGSYPRQASLDGGFASKGNLALAKSKPGLKDVAFAKSVDSRSNPWCPPAGCTNSCAAFGPASKAVSRCSSASSGWTAATGKAGSTSNSTCSSRRFPTICWYWCACDCRGTPAADISIRLAKGRSVS